MSPFGSIWSWCEHQLVRSNASWVQWPHLRLFRADNKVLNEERLYEGNGLKTLELGCDALVGPRVAILRFLGRCSKSLWRNFPLGSSRHVCSYCCHQMVFLSSATILCRVIPRNNLTQWLNQSWQDNFTPVCNWKLNSLYLLESLKYLS